MEKSVEQLRKLSEWLNANKRIGRNYGILITKLPKSWFACVLTFFLAPWSCIFNNINTEKLVSLVFFVLLEYTHFYFTLQPLLMHVPPINLLFICWMFLQKLKKHTCSTVKPRKSALKSTKPSARTTTTVTNNSVNRFKLYNNNKITQKSIHKLSNLTKILSVCM